jgi:hypothetical protein
VRYSVKINSWKIASNQLLQRRNDQQYLGAHLAKKESKPYSPWLWGFVCLSFWFRRSSEIDGFYTALIKSAMHKTQVMLLASRARHQRCQSQQYLVITHFYWSMIPPHYFYRREQPCKPPFSCRVNVVLCCNTWTPTNYYLHETWTYFLIFISLVSMKSCVPCSSTVVHC